LVLGGGNTAMDCCRTARRLGGAEVKVIVRSGFTEMKASPWEKEDAIREDVKIQENAFPWIESDAGLSFGRDGLPVVDPVTFQSSLPGVFFGGDSAFGPKNIITVVAHGHEAAISIDAFCRGNDPRARPAPLINLVS
jgi:formate dehydrogenase (NADP+) beta subunit